MAQIFKLLTNIIIILSVLAMVYFVYSLVVERGNDSIETLLRILAVATGFLLYIGSKSVGLTIPELLARSMEYNSSGFKFYFISTIIPGVAGGFVSWYILKSLDEGRNIAARVALLVAVFVFVMFTDVYVYLSFSKDVDLNGMHLLPNLSFVISLSLFAVLNYDG